MRSLAFLLAMLFAAAASPLAAFESTPLKTLVTGADSRGWEGVGRLDFAGRSFCTGALIAPDLVLTAAHCLFDSRSGRRIAPADIVFLAGYRQGRASAERGVLRAIAHPEFKFSAGDGVQRVSRDIALLRLASPIRNGSVRPFQTGDKPRKGAAVGVVSYGHGRAESPSLQEQCHVLARQSGTLVLSCDVGFGSSGAPVFALDADGNAQIVSVISAKAEVRDMQVSLGASLGPRLGELLALMAEKPQEQPAEGPRVLTLSGGGHGAKFVRP